MESCPHCHRTAHTSGAPIQHKHWCTEDTRKNPKTFLERSAKMPATPRTPAKSESDSTPSTSDTQAMSTSTPGATAPPSVESLQQQLEQVQHSHDAALAREKDLALEKKLLEGLVEERDGELEAALGQAQAAREERDDVRSDLYTVSLERDTLKKSVATPSRAQPPLPNSVQAMLEMSERHHEAFLAKMTVLLKPGQPVSSPSTKINPAARHLVTEKLLNPSEVTLANFAIWRREFELNAAANKISDEPYASRCAFVSNSLNSTWTALIHSNDVKWESTHSLDQMLEAIGTYIKKRRHPLLDRVHFLTRKQRQTESSESYLQELRALFYCTRYNEEVHYPISEIEHQNLMLRDCYLAGIHNHDMRVDILKHKLENLSLDRTIELAHNFESAHSASERLTGRPSVRAVRKSNYKQQQSQQAIDRRKANEPPADSCASTPPSPTGRPLSRPPSVQPRPHGPPEALYNHRACGSSHAWGSGCPSAKHACQNGCNQVGHFESSVVCPKYNSQPAGPPKKVK